MHQRPLSRLSAPSLCYCSGGKVHELHGWLNGPRPVAELVEAIITAFEIFHYLSAGAITTRKGLSGYERCDCGERNEKGADSIPPLGHFIFIIYVTYWVRTTNAPILLTELISLRDMAPTFQ